MKIKKGDTVKVISGVDADKVGEVLKVISSDNKVVVKGVNIRKKHKKPTRQGESGGIIETEMPINASKVMLVDPKTNQASRVGYRIVDGKKERFFKKSANKLN